MDTFSIVIGAVCIYLVYQVYMLKQLFVLMVATITDVQLLCYSTFYAMGVKFPQEFVSHFKLDTFKDRFKQAGIEVPGGDDATQAP